MIPMDYTELIEWGPYLIRALDVVLVYVLIYRLLLMVRGTRAERMLLGLGIVAFVYVISSILRLDTLNWILGNFLGSVILVIVVLFQDDFRRALTKVGLIPGLGGEHSKSQENSISEIVQASVKLSSRKVGGLIVIARDVGLEEYTEHAVRVDALLSHQLLMSIFNPAAPLHDGAVVVKGNRALAAGAVLPLTFKSDIDSELGTRHRAAIGLSERTDAIIVVISEETGSISIVREGKITRDLSEQGLTSALHRLLSPQRERRSFWSALFSKNTSREAVESTT